MYCEVPFGIVGVGAEVIYLCAETKKLDIGVVEDEVFVAGASACEIWWMENGQCCVAIS